MWGPHYMQSIHGLLSVSGLETLIPADGSTVIYPPQCHYAIARLDMHSYSREYSVELSVVGQQDVSRALIQSEGRVQVIPVPWPACRFSYYSWLGRSGGHVTPVQFVNKPLLQLWNREREWGWIPCKFATFFPMR